MAGFLKDEKGESCNCPPCCFSGWREHCNRYSELVKKDWMEVTVHALIIWLPGFSLHSWVEWRKRKMERIKREIPSWSTSANPGTHPSPVIPNTHTHSYIEFVDVRRELTVSIHWHTHTHTHTHTHANTDTHVTPVLIVSVRRYWFLSALCLPFYCFASLFIDLWIFFIVSCCSDFIVSVWFIFLIL